MPPQVSNVLYFPAKALSYGTQNSGPVIINRFLSALIMHNYHNTAIRLIKFMNVSALQFASNVRHTTQYNLLVWELALASWTAAASQHRPLWGPDASRQRVAGGRAS